ALIAAAVPMHFRLTGQQQTVHRLADDGHVLVLDQDGRHEIRSRVPLGLRTALVAPRCQHGARVYDPPPTAPGLLKLVYPQLEPPSTPQYTGPSGAAHADHPAHTDVPGAPSARQTSPTDRTVPVSWICGTQLGLRTTPPRCPPPRRCRTRTRLSSRC